MTYRFREWLRCPGCGETDIGVLAHETDVVLECYECGEISEFRLERDVPFVNVDSGADADGSGERADE